MVGFPHAPSPVAPQGRGNVFMVTELPTTLPACVESAVSALRKRSIYNALDDLQRGLEVGGGSLGGAEQTRDVYRKLISMSRRYCGEDAAPKLMQHLRDNAQLTPDAALTHSKCLLELESLRPATKSQASLSD